MLKDKINEVELKNFFERNVHQDEILVHYTDNGGKWVYPIYNPFYPGNDKNFKEIVKELVVDIYDVVDDAYLTTDNDFFRII